MYTAQIFQFGCSQVVRLPKEFRFEGQSVAITRVGKGVMLLPISEPWQLVEQALDMFEPDARLAREQTEAQTRPEMTL